MQGKANGRFFWGVATSAYQIEGATYEDGKSLSIWDVFTHQPNHIVNNENGDMGNYFYTYHALVVDTFTKRRNKPNLDYR